MSEGSTVTNSEYYIRPNSDCVEAWSRWCLPYMERTPAQSQYREGLRKAIKGLAVSGALDVSWSRNARSAPAPDVENVLIYNIGPDVFRDAATRLLRFGSRIGEVPQPPTPLRFNAEHYVRYQVIPTDQIRVRGRHSANNTDLAVCGPFDCNRSDLKKPASLWNSFKRGMKCADGESLSPDSPIKIQLTVFAPQAPQKTQLELAVIVKPMVDAFISALHYYQGKQLDSIVDRLAELLKDAPEQVRALLLERTKVTLGPYPVPHLRAKGLQWSPADHRVMTGEITREDADTLQVSGRLGRIS